MTFLQIIRAMYSADEVEARSNEEDESSHGSIQASLTLKTANNKSKVVENIDKSSSVESSCYDDDDDDER